MKSPISEKALGKLTEAIKWSEMQLAFQRKKRLEAIKELTGYHYMEGGSPSRTPIPMLPMAVQIYVRLLAARSPRALFTTEHQHLKAVAANMELAINQIPEEIGLSATLRKMVMEALFSIGVVKCGLHTVGEALDHEYGQTFVDLVTIDDYFVDMSAKKTDEFDFEGNTYWVDHEDLLKTEFVSGVNKDDIKPDEYTTIGLAGETRAESISSSGAAPSYRERNQLRDVWLPHDGLLLTLGARNSELLKFVEWNGPINGPYIKLGYTDVPGNILPLPPVALWRDLHELSNELFRKLGNQGKAAKSVLGFQGGDDEGVKNFKMAADGSGINYSGVEPKELRTSGVDAKTFAFFLQCKELASYYGGNLDNLGGLGTQSPTLGQDKLLSEAASSQMRDMADKTADAIREIFRTLAFYEWNDPIKSRRLQKPIPGTELSIPVEFNSDSKIGDFDMYDLDIDIYSLQDNSPGSRLQKLGIIVQQYVLPFAPLIQADGGSIDVQKILKLVGRYADFQELSEIVQFMEPPAGLPASARQSGMPANTTRTYERVGKPGMSQQGAEATQIQQLLAQGDGQ